MPHSLQATRMGQSPPLLDHGTVPIPKPRSPSPNFTLSSHQNNRSICYHILMIAHFLRQSPLPPAAINSFLSQINCPHPPPPPSAKNPFHSQLSQSHPSPNRKAKNPFLSQIRCCPPPPHKEKNPYHSQITRSHPPPSTTAKNSLISQISCSHPSPNQKAKNPFPSKIRCCHPLRPPTPGKTVATLAP